MPIHALNKHFDYLFSLLNPSATFIQRAASEHQSIIRLIQDASGLAAQFSPTCFLQGSYQRKTAIYTINDVDIVALCHLYPSFGLTVWSKEQRWRRDELFENIAAPLRADPRYRDKVRYSPSSMCIKVDLGIKVEILPVVYGSWLSNADSEPFLLYRPETKRWEDGYARRHQDRLTEKNTEERTGGNFIPAIKVFKHLRSLHGLEVVSFHLECLLYSLPDKLFKGNSATYITAILHAIASKSAEDWYRWTGIKTPCQERRLFSEQEWTWKSWKAFYDLIACFDSLAQAACRAPNPALAIQIWRILLGEEFFPRQVAA